MFTHPSHLAIPPHPPPRVLDRAHARQRLAGLPSLASSLISAPPTPLIALLPRLSPSSRPYSSIHFRQRLLLNRPSLSLRQSVVTGHYTTVYTNCVRSTESRVVYPYPIVGYWNFLTASRGIIGTGEKGREKGIFISLYWDSS